MADKKPDGVLVVDKPRGPTSHDIVARVRKALKTRHVGHTGTLDPMATGVLVIAVGEATKLVPWLTAADKAYETTIRLGVETDTLDAEGQVLKTMPFEASASDVDAAILVERARTLQVPPAFSAIRVDGVRAHELARAGRLDNEDLPARSIEVRALDLVSFDRSSSEITLRVEASKGYFVRSLARDLSRSLGTVGHLTALRRIRSGAFGLEDATPFDQISAETLVPVAVAATRALPVTTIASDEGKRAVMHGKRIPPEQMESPHPCPSAWVDGDGHLLAIGERDAEGFGRVLRGFVQG